MFWVCTASIYGWQYLDRVQQISGYFQHVIRLNTLTREQIEDIILKRHYTSGFTIRFEIPEKLKNSRELKKEDSEEARQAIVQNHYFNRLVDESAGNIRVAMLLWLSSIQQITEQEMVVAPDIEIDTGFLAQLSEDELFTFASIIQHEWLTIGEHEQIFRGGSTNSSLLLERMETKGLLQRDPRGFILHPFLYRGATRILQIRNIFHLGEKS